MAKPKKNQETIDMGSVMKQRDSLLNCARCLDGKDISCKFKGSVCDKQVQERMIQAIDFSEKWHRLLNERGKQAIKTRVNGFRCQNALTKEYISQPSKALAETAQELLYTAEQVTGIREQ